MRFNNIRLNKVVLLLVILLLSACGGGSGGNSDNNQAATGDFPVNDAYAAALIGKGMPEDIARFFAAAKRATNCPGNATCTYSVTYPNGATRNVTLTATPSQQYTPTAGELARMASVSNPVYDAKFSATGMESSATDTQLNISFFVPVTSIPPSPLSMAPALPITKRKADRAQILAVNGYEGIRINCAEMGTKGADVSIGSLIDYYKNLGKTAEFTGSLYAFASALSDVGSAALIAKQTNEWMKELDALEKCAKNPTNSLNQTDKDLAATLARLGEIRAEIKANSAMRFLNQMDETAEGLMGEIAGGTGKLVIGALSIPMKQGHEYAEQTLKAISEQYMQEARSSVASCTPPPCPTNLVATGVSETRINLSWNAPTTSSVTGYDIRRDGALLNNTTAAGWSDTGLTPSTAYCYVVSAYNDYGSSTNCAQACALTLGPPTVFGTSPLNNATNVAVSSPITATFSEVMNAATITTGTFTLSGPSGPVSGTVTYSGSTATFTPSAELESLKTYTATITTGVKDLDGNAMKANYTWSFTTGGNVAGNLQFVLNGQSGSFIKGNADITWNLRLDSNSALKAYWPSGTITADIALPGCNPVHITKPISSTNLDTRGDATDDGGGLDVYSSVSFVFPNTYWFWLHTDSWDQTFYCGTDNKPQIEKNYSLWLAVDECNNGSIFIPYTDAARLAGTLSCAGYSLGSMGGTLNLTWDFKNLK